ncbi:hypothetical protein GCM10023333_15320 [Ferrimonas pelagia]|uniref:DUF1249 domain-containing protein n=2 Tax=Ferrimonas pelagia TaxID=1177826 RepID=A0ABP9ERQ6_9GAMM
MASRRYAPSLDRLLRLYSRNYRNLSRLLARARRVNGEVAQYRWQHAQQALILQLTVNEQTRYTEVVTVERLAPPLPLVAPARIEIRLYHDALMAEVLTGQHFLRLLPAYPYPNARMQQRDEKFQVNLFLAELLEQFAHREWQLISAREESR